MKKLIEFLRRLHLWPKRPGIIFVRGLGKGPVAFPTEFANTVTKIYDRKDDAQMNTNSEPADYPPMTDLPSVESGEQEPLLYPQFRPSAELEAAPQVIIYEGQELEPGVYVANRHGRSYCAVVPDELWRMANGWTYIRVGDVPKFESEASHD